MTPAHKWNIPIRRRRVGSFPSTVDMQKKVPVSKNMMPQKIILFRLHHDFDMLNVELIRANDGAPAAPQQACLTKGSDLLVRSGH
jgi:hypothetical protein